MLLAACQEQQLSELLTDCWGHISIQYCNICQFRRPSFTFRSPLSSSRPVAFSVFNPTLAQLEQKTRSGQCQSHDFLGAMLGLVDRGPQENLFVCHLTREEH